MINSPKQRSKCQLIIYLNSCLTEYGCQFGCVDSTVFQSSMTTAAPTSSHSSSLSSALSSLTITTTTSTHSSSSAASSTFQPSTHWSDGKIAGVTVSSLFGVAII